MLGIESISVSGKEYCCWPNSYVDVIHQGHDGDCVRACVWICNVASMNEIRSAYTSWCPVEVGSLSDLLRPSAMSPCRDAQTTNPRDHGRGVGRRGKGRGKFTAHVRSNYMVAGRGGAHGDRPHAEPHPEAWCGDRGVQAKFKGTRKASTSLGPRLASAGCISHIKHVARLRIARLRQRRKHSFGASAD